MITLDRSNLTVVADEHSLRDKDLRPYRSQLPQYLKQIHARNQGFYTVIDDAEIPDSILRFAKATQEKYRDIIVLGIGGSALGTLCLEQSLKHLFGHELAKKSAPRLHVLDNIDPVLMQEILDILDLSKTLVIVVTKSGSTPETLAQYFYFENLFTQARLKPGRHFVFVTDPAKGLLRRLGTEKNIPCFPVPESVGGRFSVQTAVSLLPAALIGINIKKLLQGFRSMRDQFISPNFDQNLPYQLAVIQYLLTQKGKSIHVMMPYAQKLIRFADWYRQLLAESIGKIKTVAGKPVHVGITPVNALGATDQHSQSQLYNEGPNDKFIIFIEVEKLGRTVRIPVPHVNDDSVNFLKKTTFNELIAIEKRATADAYTKNNRPNVSVTIGAINEHTLGELFMLFEGATAFLGELFSINAFDQPGVELSKTLTKQYLLDR